MIEPKIDGLALLVACWLVFYVALGGLYLATGALVEFLNGRVSAELKIRSEPQDPGLRRREMGKSLQSLITVSGFIGGGLWAQEVGLNLWDQVRLQWWSAVPLLVMSLVVYDTWFYWAHRLLHTKRFYRRIHAWHHRARAPIVWSNNSDTFLDNLLLQSYFLVAAIVLPVPAAVLIVHKAIDQVAGMIGHSGYEHSPGPMSRAPSPLPGVTFHDQHHGDLRYNYGTHFTVWDRIMNTLHPAYDQRMEDFNAIANG